MHGCGNDYIIVNAFEEETFLKIQDWFGNFLLENHQESLVMKEEAKQWIIDTCKEHTGVSADGLIIINPPKNNSYDGEMVMFNSDGTYSGMCGNGLRLVVRYMVDKIIKNNNIKCLRLKSGKKIASCTYTQHDISINLGPPINVKEFQHTYGEGKDSFKATLVNMGNPHAVIISETDINQLDLEKEGPPLENHSVFPNRSNIEFINIGLDRVSQRTWERGSGETNACGSGGAAVAVTLWHYDLWPKNKDIPIYMKGGILKYTL
eukprot:CAMPEP_0117419314 /NCGR_PEP_ID=MMETSP0758-20121206/908_1 /TAXON_ID=63605 /ORGANISM="Percolomonas cosmopolitus, Strain AE-1 (ATCC 50343)" /LENGTH=262 /DNA_ID=CAMNT_0005200319 /DNA_START=58 /DNA_END=843 /DNA_ORIENTATION=-